MKDKLIIYDENCPLCCWYTGTFIKFGLLEEKGRMSFGEYEKYRKQDEPDQLDWERAHHEIPLLDLSGKETLYGIDSLLCLLNQKIPFIEYLFRFKPLRFLAKQAYMLVSYNRKIIAAKRPIANCYDCSPDFHLPYRMAFILIALLLTCTIALPIFAMLNASSIFYILLATALFAPAIYFRKKTIDYWGHLASLLLLGAIIVLPFKLVGCPPIVLIGLGVSSAIMLQQLFHRVRLI